MSRSIQADNAAAERMERILAAGLAAIPPDMLQEYLRSTDYLQGVYVIFARKARSVRKWRPLSHVGLPWYKVKNGLRPECPSDPRYVAQPFFRTMSEDEMASIDREFEEGEAGEEIGYAAALGRCNPRRSALGEEVRAFFFPDACMSFFTFAYDILRQREERGSIYRTEVGKVAEDLGLAYHGTAKGREKRTPRFQRLSEWLCKRKQNGKWLTNIGIHKFAAAATKGVVALGIEILARMKDSEWLQSGVPFNIRGHSALRRDELIPRSLLLLERTHQFSPYYYNFYGTYGLEDLTDGGGVLDLRGMKPILAMGEKLGLLLSLDTQLAEYGERHTKLVKAQSGSWDVLAELIGSFAPGTRTPHELALVPQGGGVTVMMSRSAPAEVSRYQALKDLLEERALSRDEQEEFLKLEERILSEMHESESVYYARFDRYIEEAKRELKAFDERLRGRGKTEV